MLRRIVVWSFAVAAVLFGALAYLLATGERGFSLRVERGARSIDVFRLDPADAAALGWSEAGLDDVFAHAARLSADALIIWTDGEMVASFGDLDTPRRAHSIRKAFLSAIVGLHLGSGPQQIPLDATLASLDIDDSPEPLTELQRRATVLHLLKSVSGVNHAAAAEAGLTAERDRLLGAEAHAPGTVWVYNNWDYNALTTIFERRTGLSVAEAFDAGIAGPIGMRDFSVDDVSYIAEPEYSRHRAAAFRMSARDLLLFGRLYLNQGAMEGRRIIPADWVARITEDFTRTGRDDLRWAHGYLWWIPSPETGLPAGAFWAWGLGNQAVIVVPAWETVIVHQSDTTEFLERFSPRIAEGAPAEQVIEEMIRECAGRESRDSAYCVEHRFTTRREFAELVALIVKARR